MYPYTKFGFNLWRLREARGKSSNDMAQVLHVPVKEYQGFEMGRALPNEAQLKLLSSSLKEDLDTLKNWAMFPGKKIKQNRVSPAIEDYKKRLDDDIALLIEKYEKKSQIQLSTAQRQAFEKLKHKITEIVDLPVLPMNFILICDALASVETSHYSHLHEYKDFICKGESLAGFLSRDLYYGPFLFFAANKIYFSQKPFTQIEDCFNHLTFEQFRNLFLMACVQNGIYEIEADIPLLQQHVDFTSLSCLFARQLQKELGAHHPPDIDFSLLYQACLLQGIGQYVLFATLKPYIVDNATDIVSFNDDDTGFANINTQLFKDILWALHPIVAAIIGANWQFPKAVLEIILTHHDHPVSRVEPNTALIKIINFFVDKDFPKIDKADLDDLMKAYPQVKISTTVLHAVCLQLAEIKNDLFERSSTLLQDTHENLANFSTASPTAVHTGDPHIAAGQNRKAPLKRSDFRFDPKFQTVLKTVAHQRYAALLIDILLAKKNEPLRSVMEKQAAFNLSLRYLFTSDIANVAKEFGLSVDETMLRMQK